jgi:hypothetical protein
MHTPSPYGVGFARVNGVRMQDALTVLATPCDLNDSAAPLPLTSFGLFILIHTILRNVCTDTDFTFRTQAMLDNWLKIWLGSSEAALENVGQTPPFVCNSMPFYWLAQLSLWENSSSGPAFIDPGQFDPLPQLATG